jgi:hypothetical protein
MSSILLRKLTKKSTLKFGKYKDCTVETMLGMELNVNLISIYYKLSKITFTDDILDELGITEKFRIKKPSTNEDMYRIFLEQSEHDKPKKNKQLQKMRKKTQPYRKEYLANINRGHR